jgi:hypothetical protein
MDPWVKVLFAPDDTGQPRPPFFRRQSVEPWAREVSGCLCSRMGGIFWFSSVFIMFSVKERFRGDDAFPAAASFGTRAKKKKSEETKGSKRRTGAFGGRETKTGQNRLKTNKNLTGKK